jgi:hypothetical protein
VKVRTLRRLGKLAPRRVRRGAFDLTDATMEPDPGPPPEIVFDRLTGPCDPRRGGVGLGFRAMDEEP